MSMTELLKQLEKEILQQRTDEQRLKNEIAAAVSLGFAQQAAGALEPKKHLYGFDGYLSLLQKLVTLLLAGMPPDDALDAVQTGWSAEKILEIWKYTQNNKSGSMESLAGIPGIRFNQGEQQKAGHKISKTHRK